MGYIWAVCPICRHFDAEKKLKKIKIPPCVSERLVISYAASTGNKGVSPRHTETRRDTAERYIFENYKPQGKQTGCADCAMMQAETTLPPEIQDQEGGRGNPMDGCLQVALSGNDQARKLIIAGIWSVGIAAVYRRRASIGV